MSDHLSDSERELHDGITEILSSHKPEMGDEDSVLTGYVLVSEWMDAAGDRWLASTETPTMTGWTRDGILHKRLYGWEDPSDEDGA